MSWFRQHRPQQIKDLHLISVRDTILSLMKAGNLPQAFLFAGPKGTGKTTTSRIIGAILNDPGNEKVVDYIFFKKGKKPAKLIYQEPDLQSADNQKIFEGNSFVVQEMDAASHRGIDDVRQLKERAALPPQAGKMTVFILDEAHMLTKEAFNALLKLLEEPPAHVVFILATTELHKIPDTIISRCTLMNFHKANKDELNQALISILSKEKIKYNDQSLETISKRADGSFRDAVKMLELVAKDKKEITLEKIEKILGSDLAAEIKNLIDLVLKKDKQALASFINQLREHQIDEKYFCKELFIFLHNSLLQSLGVKEGEPYIDEKIAQFLLKLLLNTDLEQSCPIPFLSLELALIGLLDKAGQGKTSGDSSGGSASKSKPIPKVSPSPKKLIKKVTTGETDFTAKLAIESTTNFTSDSFSEKIDEHASFKLFEQWERFVKEVENSNFSLGALLRSSQPAEGESNGIAKVNVYYRFHQEQLMQPKFLSIMEECSSKLIGSRVHFEFVLSQAPQQSELKETPASEKLEELAEELLM